MPSPRPKRKNVSVSQSSNIDLEMGTQDYLWKTMGNLTQDSYVKGFGPSQKAKVDDPMEWLTLLTSLKPKETPLTSFNPKETSLPFLRDRDLPDDRVKGKDYSLVFVPEESWAKLVEWELQIGPSMFTKEMSSRTVGPTECLENYRTTLGRWKANKVAFMSCVFSNQMKCSYATFQKDKTKFKVEGLLHDYGTGQLPPHGRTGLVWDVDVSRMYVPVFVKYPWGLHAYDLLLDSIKKARFKLKKNNYVLDGFSYALQIWLMEAIPDIGTLLGQKYKEGITSVRCQNWYGNGKVSYHDITALETALGNKAVVFPFISDTRNNDVVASVTFKRDDEKKDERLHEKFDVAVEASQDQIDETDEVALEGELEVSENEEQVEPVAKRRVTRKAKDPGCESRKRQLLCQRAA
ncbi:hypothetical protein F2Q68_00005966 [Brassica cretica]|uniref:DUF1985 domain-containing protein n=1 Tax=Brassica cretica TaxID=69181 RepID=A0A8S9JKE3_BRACR|nr:hypothetical protein F2Q68_00005966 [Brassica cretica]